MTTNGKTTASKTTAALKAEIAALQMQVAGLEQQIAQNNSYAPFFETALDMLVIFGSDGHFLQVNPMWERTLGYTFEELSTKPFLDFVHPDDLEATIAEAQQLINEATETVGFDNRYRAKDGTYRWLRWTATANDAGQLYGIARDITAEKQFFEQLACYAEIVKNMPIGLCVYQLENLADPRTLRMTTANPAAGTDAQVGKLMYETSPGFFETPVPELYAEVIRSGKAMRLGEVQYSDENITNGTFSVNAFPLPNQSLGLTFEDISERKRSEEAMRQLIMQEETIRAQSAALAELTTPLLTISDTTVVMPLIGTIDSRRAQQVMEVLLQGVADSNALIAIMDITGVSIVDTQVANALIRAAQAVNLLGAQVVLTGIRPEVAQTLVGLGVDLSGIITRSNLQRGIAYAIESSRSDRALA